MKLTYREIHKLIDKGIKLKVKTPDGYAYITDKFVKKDTGYKITYNDNTSTICAQSHNMQFNGTLKGATEIEVGDVDDYSGKVVVSKEKIPGQEFYDFEISNPNGLYIQNGIIHHNSGKSMTISLISDFYRTKGLRGLLLVPNINLLNQFKSDIESYNLKDLYEGTETLGGGSECTFEKPLLISTWQSMIKNKDKLDNYDYLICDEVHRESSEVSSDIIKSLTKTKIKLGFTGTLPEDKSSSMYLLGLFGEVHTYITAKELIARGLGTPIKINTIFIKHPGSVITEIRSSESYAKQLKVIEENQKRNDVICDLAIKLKNAKQNTLVLFSHTNHGKELFTEIMRRLYPDVEVQNKDITGKKSFEFQTKYKVFFINGEDDGKTRELTRKVLETYDDAILISNFQLLSTGVNIRRLYNLIFAGSLKSYNTITQSIGRGMRLYKDKKEFKVFDIVDLCYNSKRPYTGVFYKQYKHRVETSYNPEGYPIKEIELDLSAPEMW